MILIRTLDIIGPLLALCFLFFRKERARGDFLIFLFLIVQLILNVIAKFIGTIFSDKDKNSIFHPLIASLIALQPKDYNNIFLYKSNAFLSLAIAGAFILAALKKMQSERNYRVLMIYYLASLCTLVIILVSEGNTSFNSPSFSLTAFSVCSLCVFYYLTNLSNPRDENIIRTREFWLVTAFFVYYGSVFFIFLTYRIFSESLRQGFWSLWYIHNVILFASCCIILTAFKWIKT